jgi:hypothetical protein
MGTAMPEAPPVAEHELAAIGCRPDVTASTSCPETVLVAIGARPSIERCRLDRLGQVG